MKLYYLIASIGVVALSQGCASYQHGLVLDPVGPALDSTPNPGPTGKLIVFSAYDVHAHFSESPYQRFYSDYKILSDKGQPQQVVHNNLGVVSGGPKTIELPNGRYRVLARANGYGWLTVPVLIEANKLTTIHLEGGNSWRPFERPSTNNAVRLPDGRVAGWLAN